MRAKHLCFNNINISVDDSSSKIYLSLECSWILTLLGGDCAVIDSYYLLLSPLCGVCGPCFIMKY